MTKADLIEVVAKKEDITKTEAEKIVNSVFESISESLAKKDDVQIAGFGKFTVRTRAARTGKNPRTGEAIKIPAVDTPAFIAGKTLKDAVK